MLTLASLLDENVYMTLPSVMLTLKAYESLNDTLVSFNELIKDKPRFKQIQIGITAKTGSEAMRIQGNLIVQTPAFLVPDKFNVFDEFQCVT